MSHALSRCTSSGTSPRRRAHGLACWPVPVPVLVLSLVWPALGEARPAEAAGQGQGPVPVETVEQAPMQMSAPAVPQRSTPVAALVKPGRLSCGGTVFTAATHRAVPGGPVLAQQLWRQVPGDPQPQPLRHEGHPVKAAAQGPAPLDAWASGWACVQASSGQAYLHVLYTCPQDMRGCQGARREWVRLHALDGRLLNAGHPRTGDRTPALMRRLGLTAALSQGVSLSDIEEVDAAP